MQIDRAVRFHYTHRLVFGSLIAVVPNVSRLTSGDCGLIAATCFGLAYAINKQNASRGTELLYRFAFSCKCAIVSLNGDGP
jgi:hypothetical protein